ncbi:hypothetical protein GYH30_044595 [Glycine max]|nr:hypothetical protein GYH30_044595 [Glycine max]
MTQVMRDSYLDVSSLMVVCKCLYVEATENGFEGFHIQASAESFNLLR